MCDLMMMVGVKMVIDFAASWCGPCRFMEPAVKSMASTYTDVGFVKIDVDELPVCLYKLHISLSMHFLITVMMMMMMCLDSEF